MHHQVIIVMYESNPLYDPALQAAAVSFMACFLGFSACGLWLLRKWTGRR